MKIATPYKLGQNDNTSGQRPYRQKKKGLVAVEFGEMDEEDFMSELKKEIYRLMDNFLVETDPPRSIKQLNRDRHLFVKNLLDVFSFEVKQAVGENKPENSIRKLSPEELSDKNFPKKLAEKIGQVIETKGYNEAKSEIIKKFKKMGVL